MKKIGLFLAAFIASAAMCANTADVGEKTSSPGGYLGLVCSLFPSMREHPVLAYVIPAGIVLLLVAILVFVRATRRAR